jgi:hypothetical protein
MRLLTGKALMIMISSILGALLLIIILAVFYASVPPASTSYPVSFHEIGTTESVARIAARALRDSFGEKTPVEVFSVQEDATNSLFLVTAQHDGKWFGVKVSNYVRIEINRHK